MLSQLAAHITEIKLTLAALIGLGAWLADASETLNAKGWEEASLKVLLILAVIAIGKLFLDAKKEHKADIVDHKKDIESQKNELKQVIVDNTKVLTDLAALTREQTDYFKAVTRNVVNEKLNGGKPTLP